MNVVFDFGGVLFDWQPRAFLRRLMPHRAADDAAAQRLATDVFQSYGGDWAEFDRGTVEADELASRIAARTGLPRDELVALIAAVPHELVPIDATVELLRGLHAQRRRLYFLSNMPEPYARHLEERHDFIGLFGDGVFSARVQLIKPEPQIFEHASARFGIRPQDSVFIDDHAANIAAAQAAGWNTVHFRNAAQCRAALDDLGLI